jgi:ribosomal protein S18 acetylase RimI-like enzyme
MRMIAIHEKGKIENFLNKTDKDNFMYFYNNLEVGFWENTQWFGLENNGEILSLAMLILKYETPVLLASCYHEDHIYQKDLIKRLYPYLPKKIYCHLDLKIAEELFAQTHDIQIFPFHNMKLAHFDGVKRYGSGTVQQLWNKDTNEILAFLEVSHPDYLIDVEFINQGLFFGIKEESSIVSLAGVVAKSDKHSIVSIGNVATHPRYRQRNLASKTISALALFLQPKYQSITLNVKENNQPAIKCYKKLGFVEVGHFEEVIFS